MFAVVAGWCTMLVGVLIGVVGVPHAQLLIVSLVVSQNAIRVTTLPLSSRLGRARTCDLLIRSLNWYVLTGSRLLVNLAHSGRKSGFPCACILLCSTLFYSYCCHTAAMAYRPSAA
jgi:hypothetical protein